MAKALYPFANHYLNRSGLRYHYLDEGQGEPLVMLHGNPTWSFYYRNLVLGLRDAYRTIVPDHIGCGLSDKPDDSRYEYSLRQRVADLEALLDHLELRDNLTLVLHDWGGMIGMAFAHRHPERIKRLVILNTAAFPCRRASVCRLRCGWCRTPLIGPLLVRGLNAFSRGAIRYCVRKPLPRGRSQRLSRSVRFVAQSHRRPAFRAGHPAGAGRSRLRSRQRGRRGAASLRFRADADLLGRTRFRLRSATSSTNGSRRFPRRRFIVSPMPAITFSKTPGRRFCR